MRVLINSNISPSEHYLDFPLLRIIIVITAIRISPAVFQLIAVWFKRFWRNIPQ